MRPLRRFWKMAKMAVAKKDQERITYAWLYGSQARKDGKAREVPPYWQEYAEAWLQGFDGAALASISPAPGPAPAPDTSNV